MIPLKQQLSLSSNDEVKIISSNINVNAQFLSYFDILHSLMLLSLDHVI